MHATRFQSRFGHLPKLTEHQIGRPKLKLRNPLMAGVLEVISQPLYDYYEVALNTALTKQLLFSIPLGQPYTPAGGTVFSKQLLHTNLVQAGVLQSPNKQLVRALTAFVRNDATPADVITFTQQSQLEWTINGKVYLEVLLGKVPAGGGAYLTSTQTNVGASNNGWPANNNIYLIGQSEQDTAQMIEQQQTFAVQIDPTQVQGGAATLNANTTNPVGTGIKCWIGLEGDLYRAVQ